MHILIITQRWYPDTFGGSEHVAAEQARRLAARGHQVTVLTEYTDARLAPEEQLNRSQTSSGLEVRLRLRVIRYGQPQQFKKWGSSLMDMKLLPKLARGLHAKEKFDLAILHHPYPAFGFFLAHLKIPALYIFHASTAREAEVEGVRRKLIGLKFLMRPLLVRLFIIMTRYVERRALGQSEKIAVLSDYSRQLLQETYPQPKNKIIKLGVGIHQDIFQPAASKAEAKQRLGFPSDKPIILTVRRLTARMGLHEFLAAASLARPRFPQAKFLIIGEGPLREQLINEIGQLNLQSFVTMIGLVPLKELPWYYQAADLFVLPTAAFEGLGMATLEALACGTPVVGTPAGATPEILNKIDPSLVVKSTKAEDIATGILDFLGRSQEEKTRLGQKAREVIERDYNWEKAIEELEQILTNL